MSHSSKFIEPTEGVMETSYQSQAHVPNRRKFRTAEFGVKKSLLIQKVLTEKMGVLVVSELRLTDVPS